ncbi:MAG: NAD-dependent protein deacylase, partial [Anaerotignaceae bacterium]
ETILSHSFFLKNKEVFYEYYKNFLLYPDAKPNKAHYALAKLEKMGKVKSVVTQNIDNLHQKAGSEKVLELHGTLYKNYCLKCKEKYSLDYVISSKGVTTCEKCGGVVRPDVVLYEEGLNQNIVQEAIKYISAAEVLIVGGTSLNVYPAAGLINYYKGDKLVLINKSVTPFDNKADLCLHMDIEKAFEFIID